MLLLMVLSADLLVFSQMASKNIIVFTLHSDVLREIPICEDCFLAFWRLAGNSFEVRLFGG